MSRLESIADLSDDFYRRLAGVLDTLPNGFPSTPDGLEIRILKKIFTPEEAELFCDLKLTPEPAAQIAERTGRPLEGLEDQLISMAKRGEIVGVKVGECICKKEQGVLGHPCGKSTEVCLTVMPVEGVEPLRGWGGPISKEEVYAILKKSEEEGLVHLSGNVENGQSFFCNCCGVLRAINELNVPNVVNAHFCSEIDEDECTSCGICLEERCQVGAIEEVDDTYRVIPERCIGCGLCATDCPAEAIRLSRRADEEIVIPPEDSSEWNNQRTRQRGVDYSAPA